MTTYYEKLKSPKWQKKRLEILSERGFGCEVCSDKDSQLHVHHKIYKKGVSPWSYPSYNYSVLCEECHKDAHNTIDAMNELVGVLPVDGHFSQQGVLSFLLNFLSSEDEWVRATDQQLNRFYEIQEEFNIPNENLMSYVGMVSNLMIPIDGKKVGFMKSMKDFDLSNIQLADLFSYIALNYSSIHPDEINCIRNKLGAEDI